MYNLEPKKNSNDIIIQKPSEKELCGDEINNAKNIVECVRNIRESPQPLPSHWKYCWSIVNDYWNSSDAQMLRCSDAQKFRNVTKKTLLWIEKKHKKDTQCDRENLVNWLCTKRNRSNSIVESVYIRREMLFRHKVYIHINIQQHTHNYTNLTTL